MTKNNRNLLTTRGSKQKGMILILPIFLIIFFFIYDIYNKNLSSTKFLLSKGKIIGVDTNSFQIFLLSIKNGKIVRREIPISIKEEDLHLIEEEKNNSDKKREEKILKRLVSLNLVGSISVSSTGEKITIPIEFQTPYYKKFSREIGYKKFYALVIYFLKNKKVKPLITTKNYIFLPSWSPDDRKIVYLEEKAQFRKYNLNILYIDRNYKVVKIKKIMDGVRRCYPCWLSDSKRVLVVAEDGGIYMIDLERKQKRKIVEGYSVCCLPGDKKIVFANRKNIYVADINGKNKEILIRHFTSGYIGAGVNLQCSPDGKLIAYNGEPFFTFSWFSFSGVVTNLIISPLSKEKLLCKKLKILQDYDLYRFRWVSSLKIN